MITREVSWEAWLMACRQGRQHGAWCGSDVGMGDGGRWQAQPLRQLRLLMLLPGWVCR